jgi:DNA ligase-1
MLKIYFYVFLLLACMRPVTNAVALDILLPMVYQEDIDISNWVMSEKLDGVRGYWDGKKLLSKNGLPFNPPEAFTKNFPDFAVEGELWGGRNTFERTSGIVMRHEAHDGWLGLKFGIFDVPEAGGGFLQRLNMAIQWFEKHPSEYAFVIIQKTVTGKDHLREELLRVEKLGGEGLIVRNPDSLYTIGRSVEILKVKSYYDMEATVIEHIEGTGRNYGRMGSILVELKDRTQFKIGTGFSDEERNNPPPIGAIITFRYYGFYKSGIPKFPSYLRTRQIQ